MTRTRTALALAATTFALAATTAAAHVPHDGAPTPAPAVQTAPAACPAGVSDLARFICFRRAATVANEAHGLPVPASSAGR